MFFSNNNIDLQNLPYFSQYEQKIIQQKSQGVNVEYLMDKLNVSNISSEEFKQLLGKISSELLVRRTFEYSLNLFAKYYHWFESLDKSLMSDYKQDIENIFSVILYQLYSDHNLEKLELMCSNMPYFSYEFTSNIDGMNVYYKLKSMVETYSQLGIVKKDNFKDVFDILNENIMINYPFDLNIVTKGLINNYKSKFGILVNENRVKDVNYFNDNVENKREDKEDDFNLVDDIPQKNEAMIEDTIEIIRKNYSSDCKVFKPAKCKKTTSKSKKDDLKPKLADRDYNIDMVNYYDIKISKNMGRYLETFTPKEQHTLSLSNAPISEFTADDIKYFIDKNGKPNLKCILRVMKKMAKAYRAFTLTGYQHNDISLKNFFIHKKNSRSEIVKLGNYGLLDNKCTTTSGISDLRCLGKCFAEILYRAYVLENKSSFDTCDGIVPILDTIKFVMKSRYPDDIKTFEKLYSLIKGIFEGDDKYRSNAIAFYEISKIYSEYLGKSNLLAEN